MRTRRSRFSGNQVPSTPEVKPPEQKHLPVLLHEVLSGLAIRENDVVVDATLGGAGHALAMAKQLGESGVLVGFDEDHDAIERARVALSGVDAKTILVKGNFRDIAKHLPERGIQRIDKALFDLGWSSYQLAVGRGFSLMRDEPLLMTFATHPAENSLTAAKIVNEWEESSIADVLYGWGEERYSRRIAKGIVERRAIKPLTTTSELVETIVHSVPASYRHGKIHPATRTFQALRIAVNDELGSLTKALADAWRLLAPSGRIAVISFHSLEDRIVKQTFRQWHSAGEGLNLTKKPIIAGPEELRTNPRAHSAKLRIIEKI